MDFKDKELVYYISKEKNKPNKQNLFISIKNLIDNQKFSAAETELVKFLSKYYDDVPALYEYGKLLAIKGDYYNSIKVLKSLLDIQKQEPYVQATYSYLFKIYYKNDMYKEAYEIVDKVYLGEYDINIKTFKSILELKLNLPLSIKSDNRVYTIEQEKSYNKEEVLNHIKRHYSINPYVVDSLTINENIDIEKIFDKVEKVLPVSNKSDYFSSCDTYFFYYPSIGCNQETKIPESNILKVVVLKGTNKIINMYPCKRKNISFNNNLHQEEKTKVLKKNMIERFNNRYKKGLKYE